MFFVNYMFDFMKRLVLDIIILCFYNFYNIYNTKFVADK